MRTKNRTRRFEVSKFANEAIWQDIEIAIGGKSNYVEKEWVQFRFVISEVAEQNKRLAIRRLQKTYKENVTV